MARFCVRGARARRAACRCRRRHDRTRKRTKDVRMPTEARVRGRGAANAQERRLTQAQRSRRGVCGHGGARAPWLPQECRRDKKKIHVARTRLPVNNSASAHTARAPVVSGARKRSAGRQGRRAGWRAPITSAFRRAGWRAPITSAFRRRPPSAQDSATRRQPTTDQHARDKPTASLGMSAPLPALPPPLHYGIACSTICRKSAFTL
jgi:hypothetical protein